MFAPMKIALIIIAVIFAVSGVVLAIGYSLPVKHRAQRETVVRQTPAAVFAAITDVKAFPTWRASVKSAEVLPDSGGKRRYREVGSDGEILYEVERSVPNQQLVTRIADPSLPFGGRWTFDLIPAGDATTLRITEDGEVYNPFFRFVSRFVIGHTGTIDRYLRDLSKHLQGEPPTR
jgi:uncharacterized protein YndB with AHSA1/START domain